MNELAELGGSNNTIAEATMGDIMIDPTLTMDWTTLNPPGLDSVIGLGSEEASPSDKGGAGTAGTTKEAESPLSKMDTGPARTNVTATTSVAVLAGEAKEAESAAEAIDTEPDRAGGDGAVAGAANGTDAGSPPEGVDGGDEGAGNDDVGGGDGDGAASSFPPIPRATAPPSGDASVTAPTTPPTASPTAAYEEHVDESLDPVANGPTEGFKDGEAPPPGEGNGGSEDESPSPGTRTDDVYREEEEVKKVGGWLSVTSIILMIYTAYQMSENPDGICAR